MSADLTPLVEVIRRSNRSLRRKALWPVVPIVGALFMPFPDEVPFMVLRWSFIALCVFISGALLAIAKSPASSPGLKALRDPGNVCWLYIERARNPHNGEEGEPVLRVGLTDGQRLVLPVEKGLEDVLLDLAATAAPHAARGWTPELELRFLQEPTSVLSGGHVVPASERAFEAGA